ncbi:hypothetical protein VQY18_02430 [Mycoplasma feriruminatoris]|uniref:Lipoprotein n=1 Tax=Mycoplasma feriruminatoris TaxID=1179777 RepID=A0A654IMZ7_9MOLU|nr:hypothetical protein MF5583_00492 [Mycoplasma feriruminatoris]
MKKFLTILSFLTTISSSLAVVACKTPMTSIKGNDTNNDLSNKENNSDKNKTVDKQKEPNTKSPNNTTQSDEPQKTPEQIEKEGKKFTEKIKEELNAAIKKNDLDKIKEISEAVVSKNLQTTSNIKLNEISTKFNSKIQKWQKNMNLDEIQLEFLTIFNEYISGSQKTEAIKKYTQITKDTNIKTIIDKLQHLFRESLQTDLEEEYQKVNNDFNNLIKDKKYENLKEKLFDLIDKTIKLEKPINKR